VAVEGLSIRLLLDHHINPRLATDLRPQGFDVTFPRELGTERASDEEHLTWATERGRVVLTEDRADFQILAQRWAEHGRDHAGIILVNTAKPVSYGELLRRLRAFLDAVSAEEMVNQVRWLDERWSRGT
jgi:predicted nuclease of predicted toxin-antitoxin system